MSDVDDERPAARAVAEAVGAEHVEILFTEADFWRLLPQIVSAVDDPAADYAMLPTFALAGAAREAGLKVILSGEGGDELFGGYGRYRSVLRPWWAGGRRPRARGVLDDLGVLRGEIAGWRDGIAAAEVHAASRGRTPLQAAQAVDCTDWLPNDLLTKLDRCLMAHGAEGRTPFLDTEMAVLAFRLPDELKIQHGLGKWLLRRWLAGQLPQSQPLARKRGFTVPVARLDRTARRDDRPARRALAGGARDLPARRGRDSVCRRRAKARRPRRLEFAVLCTLAPPPYRARDPAARYRSSAGRGRLIPRRPIAANSSRTASSRNLASAGFCAGLPARWPQIDGIGRNSARGMRATSRRLSSTVK